ncbi:SH3 domain-containing protein [Ancylobacter sp. IITR112]|uniref:SH3 domain-containing protein n=1 Tax=Ancylobacter sp. IITR112 TaxID=3138073 RepID=UPI00352ACCE8
MATTSQQTRGNGLSTSLISDFRTIVSSLEQEKAGREGGEPGGAASAAAPAADDDLHSFGDVRSRIAALGDMSDVLAARPASRAEPMAPTRADSSPQAARRRSFGSAARQPGESEARRKRSASKDIITWQRLGLLAVFMAVVGGGAVLLQSLAAREEAKVAPEVIGNAAVASVAPSTQAETPSAVALKPLELSGAAIQASVPSSPTPSVLAHGTAADNLPPILLNASGRSSSASEPATPASGVTAFAAPDPVAPSAAAIPDAVEGVPAAGEAVANPAPEAPPPPRAALPESAPLPPARAPLREVAAATPPAPAADTASAAGSAPAAIPAAAEPLPPGFGGDPVGTAVTRRAVTMRAAPKKGAAAIGNLPGGKQVELVTCQQWCEIVVDGKRAFVYKSFIDTGAVAAAAGPATEEAGDAVEAEAGSPE